MNKMKKKKNIKLAKNAGWTIDEIKKALNESTKLEFNEDKNKIRRKNNKPLPELNLLNKKSKRNVIAKR